METTICGIATGYGQNGISVIRISGPESEKILKKIFRFKSSKYTEFNPRYMHYGYIFNEDQVLDEVLSVFMPAPNTYTGEDVCEIHCHGGTMPVKKILDLCVKEGCQLAGRGEFTKRAFLNGKLDLPKAESIMDIINSEYEESYNLALQGIKGEFSKAIRAIRDRLKDIRINMIVNIEYPEEDIEEIVYNDLKKQLISIKEDLKSLSDTYDRGKIIKDGIKVSIIGKPNVGKSSLMNIIAGEERAIVTKIEGTTRDIISERVILGGLLVELVDTAGIREASDEIEKIGINKSKEAIEASDVILFIMDGSKSLEKEDLELIDLLKDKLVIPVLNKSDLDLKVEGKLPFTMNPVKTSFKENIGIEELEKRISETFTSDFIGSKDTLMISNERHKELVDKSIVHIEDSITLVDNMEVLDLIEVDINESYSLLGEIIGENISDDILKEVFQKFCLGK